MIPAALLESCESKLCILQKQEMSYERWAEEDGGITVSALQWQRWSSGFSITVSAH